MKKRWRLETKPPTSGVATGARWGPWRTSVEVHQVAVVVSTDATVANRTLALRHSLLAPFLQLSEVAITSALTASLDSVRATWGQGYNATNVSVDTVNRIQTAFLPFAFILSVGEILDVILYNPQVGDTMTNAVIMVRDLDDVERGR